MPPLLPYLYGKGQDQTLNPETQGSWPLCSWNWATLNFLWTKHLSKDLWILSFITKYLLFSFHPTQGWGANEFPLKPSNQSFLPLTNLLFSLAPYTLSQSLLMVISIPWVGRAYKRRF
jgi:hypothetical protein